MFYWSESELRKIAEADDLHVAPFREDGVRSLWMAVSPRT
jgi:hypothetical protein